MNGRMNNIEKVEQIISIIIKWLELVQILSQKIETPFVSNSLQILSQGKKRCWTFSPFLYIMIANFVPQRENSLKGADCYGPGKI